jgi:sugar lactone lactonase YvrE
MRYDGPAGLKDRGTGIAVSPDGSSVFVAGSSEHATDQYDKATIAYASDTGAEVWSARDDSNWGWTLAVTPDGATVAAPGVSTVAYDTTTGTARWSADDQTMFIVADPDVTQVVTASDDTLFAYAT